MKPLTVLWILIGGAVVVYAAYCAHLWSAQRGMMFPGAQMRVTPDQRDWPPRGKSVVIGGAETAVHAVWVPASAPGPATAVIFLHGNAEFAFQSVPALSRLVGPSRHLLLVEYPGYAGAPGEPGRDSIRDASIKAYDWLLEQPDVDARRIVVIGRSLGGGPATELSRSRPLAAMVLISTFTSVADIAVPMRVPAFLIRDSFDNRAGIAAFNGPVLVLHGQRDDVIPYAHGQALGKVSKNTKFIPLACAHNDCALDGGKLRRAVEAFLVRHDL